MKRSVVLPLFGFAFLLFITPVFCLPAPVAAEEHPQTPGLQIHTAVVDGYRFDYMLYDFPEQKTQHLMVSITAPDGTAGEQGKVGFLITEPDGSKQKAMAMGMKGAYGANADFSQKGVYSIKTKVVLGDRKLFDQFTYEVK